MVVNFASEDNVVFIKSVRFKKHRKTDEAIKEERALKLRARFSRSLSPERVEEDAFLRAAEIERKVKKYNEERSSETQFPNSVSGDAESGSQYLEQLPEWPESKRAEASPAPTAGAPHSKTTAKKRSGSYESLKIRFSTLFSSRSKVSGEGSKKPNAFASIRARFIGGRSRSKGLEEHGGHRVVPIVSAEHEGFDSVCPSRAAS
eukprot:TRINITY_DN17182_c0_g1_i2.p1 TRINITY_DN17182_c0_g1~~TRINITY_DN17182_c0_g1_i2.p1  ORF type:complete len:204 (+),score=40.68 TRINITY_DN17182_c0_g1_i2:955-1566(+)